jgi:hypothetical protein
MSDDTPPPEVEEAFDVTHELLLSTIRDDHEKVEEIAAREIEWWNVVWTLALLIRHLLEGQPAALRLLADIVEEARGSSK